MHFHTYVEKSYILTTWIIALQTLYLIKDTYVTIIWLPFDVSFQSQRHKLIILTHIR